MGTRLYRTLLDPLTCHCLSWLKCVFLMGFLLLFVLFLFVFMRVTESEKESERSHGCSFWVPTRCLSMNYQTMTFFLYSVFFCSPCCQSGALMITFPKSFILSRTDEIPVILPFFFVFHFYFMDSESHYNCSFVSLIWQGANLLLWSFGASYHSISS